MRRTYERGTKARLDFSRGPEPVWKKWMSVGKNAGIPFWKRLLCCTALHFMRQIFANPWSSSGLPTPLWIQNYQISAMFTRGVARQRSSASLWCRARTFCAWLWNSLIVIAASVSEWVSEWMCESESEWASEWVRGDKIVDTNQLFPYMLHTLESKTEASCGHLVFN